MALSKYIDELIEEWESYATPQRKYPFPEVTYYHFASALLVVRDEIEELGLNNDLRVMEIDKKLIEYVVQHGSDPPYKAEPREYPLEKWWWHLNEIGEKRYPAEFLPEHLREIYLKT